MLNCVSAMCFPQNHRTADHTHLAICTQQERHTANPPSRHPSECWQLRKRAAGMRRNRLVDNGGESELRYWFKCSHMVSFAAGEGMIKSTGAAHKCRSAGFRFSARIMCCRTFWLDAYVGNEPQITPRLWFDEVPLKCCLKCFAKVWSLVSWMEYSKRNLWRLGSFIAA